MNSPTVSFATSCWERDWRLILLDPDYLKVRQIANHRFPFVEKLLIINNVQDLPAVIQAAQKKVDEGVLTRFVVAEEAMLAQFHLRRSDFQKGADGVQPDWLYYNALGPLSAIAQARSDYLLYMTGDVRLNEPLDWIRPSLRFMEKNPNIVVANPVWNEEYRAAKRESYRTTWNFYVAREGFSDQLFLVRKNDFFRPIYGEIRPDSHHFPRGDVFEKRVFSYMKNRKLERIIYRRGSYIHENI